MKLLFDENLSPKLPRLLAELFPDSAHVRDCGLLGFPDEDVWEYARVNDFIIVSKDSDFQQRSLLYGQPPKIVWLRIGNCTREQVIQLIKVHELDIRALAINPIEAVLVLCLIHIADDKKIFGLTAPEICLESFVAIR